MTLRLATMRDVRRHDNMDLFCTRHVKSWRMKTPWSLAMKKLINSLPVLFAVTFLVAACGQKHEAPEASAENSKIFDMPYLMRDLDNGLRVIVVPTDYPDIVSIQIPANPDLRTFSST
jgi:hypothetical protein